MNSGKMKRFIIISLVVFISIFFTRLSSADPLDNWNWRNPLPQGNPLNGVAYGSGIFLAVGDNGMILTSADGITWASRTSGTSYPLGGVTYGNGIFVAVGDSGTILTSADGITWASRTSGTDYRLYGVTYGNGIFVAVGGREILTSADGITWTSRSSGTSNPLGGVTYGNGIFVAVGGGVLTSADGITWTSRTSDTYYSLSGVTYGNGTFLAVGEYPNDFSGPLFQYVILTSVDGIAWTSRIGTGLLHGVTYGNGTFLAVGDSGFFGYYSGSILTSADGITWTSRTSRTNNPLRGVTYGNGTFIAVGDGGAILQSDPVDIAPHITANNSSGHSTVNEGDPLSVSVSLDAKAGLGFDADWWLAAYTPSGWYYYVYPDQWVYASVLDDVRPAYQGALADLSPLEVLNTTQLPAGEYTVYFGVDLDRNGIIDFDRLYLDSIVIDVVGR